MTKKGALYILIAAAAVIALVQFGIQAPVEAAASTVTAGSQGGESYRILSGQVLPGPGATPGQSIPLAGTTVAYNNYPRDYTPTANYYPVKPVISGTKWISFPNGARVGRDTIVRFTKTVTAPEAPQSATVKYLADDFLVRLAVNGHVVSAPSGNFNTISSVNIPASYLKTGSNVFEFDVQQGTAEMLVAFGVDFQITITSGSNPCPEECTPPPQCPGTSCPNPCYPQQCPPPPQCPGTSCPNPCYPQQCPTQNPCTPTCPGSTGGMNITQCNDGLDNDFDGKVDLADPGCQGNPLRNTEFDRTGGTGSSGNPAPTCPAISSRTISAGQTISLTYYANDTDQLNYAITGLPANASFSNNYFTFTPQSYQAGNSYPLTIRATDTQNQSCQASFTVTVQGGGYGTNMCNDGIDNDYDGRVDYNDPDCARTNGASEYSYTTGNMCADGMDNDYDGRVDYADPDCITSGGTSEFTGSTGNQSPYFASTPIVSARAGQVYAYQARAIDPEGSIVSYGLSVGPQGLTINPTTGYVQWIPTASQANRTNAVVITASDGIRQMTQSFSIYVQPAATTGGPVYTNPPSTSNPPATTSLKITNVRVNTDANLNVIVSFETTQAANGRLIFGLHSEAEKTKDFGYEFSSPGTTVNTTVHQINLGRMQVDLTYYLRAQATAGKTTVTSPELVFVQLPTGDQGGEMSDTDDSSSTLASVFSTIGGWIISPWFLLLLIILLLVLLLLRRGNRRDDGASVVTSGPVEIRS